MFCDFESLKVLYSVYIVLLLVTFNREKDQELVFTYSDNLIMDILLCLPIQSLMMQLDNVFPVVDVVVYQPY